MLPHRHNNNDNPVTSTHEPHRGHRPRNLSVVQEEVLIAKVEAYVERGTLLTPPQITELATAPCGHTMGRNWTSTFLRRHRDQLLLRFHKRSHPLPLLPTLASLQQFLPPLPLYLRSSSKLASISCRIGSEIFFTPTLK